MIPLTMAAGRISLPDTLRITGRHTSIAVAPADATGANGPKCLFIAWAATNVNSSSCRQCQYQINHNSQKSAKDSNFRIKAQIEYLMKNV